MAKRKSQGTARGRAISEQRRSNAAGKHGKTRKDRRNNRRKAIQDSREN
jgi:hypothetical protein